MLSLRIDRFMLKLIIRPTADYQSSFLKCKVVLKCSGLSLSTEASQIEVSSSPTDTSEDVSKQTIFFYSNCV